MQKPEIIARLERWGLRVRQWSRYLPYPWASSLVSTKALLTAEQGPFRRRWTDTQLSVTVALNAIPVNYHPPIQVQDRLQSFLQNEQSALPHERPRKLPDEQLSCLKSPPSGLLKAVWPPPVQHVAYQSRSNRRSSSRKVQWTGFLTSYCTGLKEY